MKSGLKPIEGYSDTPHDGHAHEFSRASTGCLWCGFKTLLKVQLVPAKPKTRRSPTAGNRGLGSNWIPKKRRRQIYARDGHACIWCTSGAFKLTLDHVVPRRRGGTNRTDNLIAACMPCNSRRGERSLYEYAHAHFANPIEVILRVLAALEKPLLETDI